MYLTLNVNQGETNRIPLHTEIYNLPYRDLAVLMNPDRMSKSGQSDYFTGQNRPQKKVA